MIKVSIVTGVVLPYYMKFSRHVNFAFLKFAYFATLKFRDFAKMCILTHFIIAFLSETHFISLSMLFNMSLNLIVEAIERFQQLVEQHYKESVNEQFEDCKREVLPGTETESSSDEEGQKITAE